MRALPLLAILVAVSTSPGMHSQQSSSAPAHADPILYGMDIFRKGADSTTEVNTGPVTPEVLQQRLATGKKHVSLSTIYTFSYATDGVYRTSDLEAVRARLSPALWRCSLDTRHLSPGEQRQRCVRRISAAYTETVWIDAAARSLTFIHTISAGDADDPEF